MSEVEHNTQKKASKRLSIIIIVAIVIAAGILAICFWFMNRTPAASVVIKVDGDVKYSEDIRKNQTITVEGYDGGYNIVHIQDGIVNVTEADCDNQICVNTSTISTTGQTITCLPHRVVVEIVGGSDGVDSVAQ